MRPNLNSVAVGRAVSSRLPHSLACAAKRTRALSSDIKVGRHALCGPRSNRARAMSCGFWFLQLNRAANGRYGSSTEMLRLSISRLLFLTKADADRASAGCTVGQGPRSHAARNAAFIGNDEPCHASEQRDRLVRVAALGFLEIEENWKVFTLPRRRGPDPGDLDAPAGPPFTACRPYWREGPVNLSRARRCHTPLFPRSVLLHHRAGVAAPGSIAAAA